MWSAIPDREEPDDFMELEMSHSPFVEVVDGNEFDIKMQYPLLKMEHAESRCFLRKEVYEKLLLAQEALPLGLRFRILDAWRPFKLQEELYMKYSQKIIKQFELESKTMEEQKKVLKQYVSEPRTDRFLSPSHTTGGAIDLTLIDLKGTELNMGTGFDSFSTETHTSYFENSENIEVRDNRRILYHVMKSACFTNLPSEWWHFDYGDRFWAFYNHKPARYEGVFEVAEVKLGKR